MTGQFGAVAPNPPSPSVFARLRPYLPMALLAFFIVYFSIQALTGDRGLLSSTLREQTLAAKTAELTRWSDSVAGSMQRSIKPINARVAAATEQFSVR